MKQNLLFRLKEFYSLLLQKQYLFRFIVCSMLFTSAFLEVKASYYTYPTAVINTREKSIALKCLSYFYNSSPSENERWEVDQWLFYTGASVDAKVAVDDINKVLFYTQCGSNDQFNNYDIIRLANTSEDDDATKNPATTTYFNFKWYNVPSSLTGSKLSVHVDNDAGANESCSSNDWNNDHNIIYSITINDYFKITPSIDYTAKTSGANQVTISYTISNTSNAAEDVTYLVKCYNEKGNEVGSINSKDESGSFIVTVADPLKAEQFTLKASTSLSISDSEYKKDNNGNFQVFPFTRTISHNFEKSITVAAGVAPCVIYSYKLVAVSDQDKQTSGDFSDTVYYKTDISQALSNLKISKGYFPGKTTIEWSCNKLLDNFVILRKIAGSSDNPALIKTVDATSSAVSGSIRTYSEVDETGDPGVVYEYIIRGTIACAEGNAFTNDLADVGFRTPTGDIYGRVTFESGQAEEGVEINLETSNGLQGKSLLLGNTDVSQITNTGLLKTNADSITIQAWVAPTNSTGKQVIFSKPGMYELGINNDLFYFTAGINTVNSSEKVRTLKLSTSFIHITGVNNGDSLLLYINGNLSGKIKRTAAFTGTDNPITLGGNYAGAIDEVRIWGSSLTAAVTGRDYKRYLTGGEDNLLAYWSFNYSTDAAFFDLSFQGSKYNKNDGLVNTGSISSTVTLTNDQLSYKGITDADGSYSIRAVPYIGNGTLYSIIPLKGIHAFESAREVRFLGSGSQTHTVNFTDKSSFKVTGTVHYKNGTIPVQGVSFTIDGISAMTSTGSVITTDNKGQFEISVPVGTHQVVALKQNHLFENGGKITDSNLKNRNYQDEVLGLELIDTTTVKFIGRVAGGTIQEALPLGHSLSKNNVADNVKVILTTKNQAYKISNSDITQNINHFLPSDKVGKISWPKGNSIDYSATAITIHPNAETGEFVANIIPELFSVSVSSLGYDWNAYTEDVDFSKKLGIDSISAHNYTDSVSEKGQWIKNTYADLVHYNISKKFIWRQTPVVRITQLNSSNKHLPYFGEKTYSVARLDNTTSKISLYDSINNKYILSNPVFIQGSTYKFKAEIFEQYKYNNKDDGKIDEVPTQDASVEFTNAISTESSTTVSADSIGVALYSFQATDPEFTSAVRSISAKVKYGTGSTSINWSGGFEGIILGATQTGHDFVTTGPNKLLTILRDPPGSNSYSYLEKGSVITESSSYTGEVANEGSELWTNKLGTELVTFVGLGGGKINSVAVSEGVTIGVIHEETVGGTDSNESVTTTTTRFQTSSDPAFVGADGDVFVGNSTNITYGATVCVSVITDSIYNLNPTKYSIYSSITPVSNPLLLVKQTGLGIAQTFGTLFMYPQSHIVNRLIPETTNLRNQFLMQLTASTDVSALQKIADDKDTVFYLSRLEPTDPNYGKSNIDNAFDGMTDPNPSDDSDGNSYKIIYPANPNFSRNDTILFLNQTIQNWKNVLADNEKAKLNATLLQNYSYHGGSELEYSEAYSEKETHTTRFSLMIGGNISNEFGTLVDNTGIVLNVDETVSTKHSGEFTSDEEKSHVKGFVLSEDGDDYLSVDVMHEENSANDYSSFIFRTKAGATSCPYEGEYRTEYYQPGKYVIDEATKQIEVPEIAVEKDFIENVPSGENANFKIYLRNNSEVNYDNWFDFKLVDASNPNGAKFYMDGSAIGNGRSILVPAGATLEKNLEIGKGTIMNYDNLKVVLQSQCQVDATDYRNDLSDTLSLSVHFTPSCSNVNIYSPTDNWTYNTKLPTTLVNGVSKHYMDVRLNNFDVNYDNFNHIELQYKSSAQSDDQWSTLMNYFNDSTNYKSAVASGSSAEMIKTADAGVINYKFFMDDLPDQKYDLRAISICSINNVEYENASETRSGIKDMYNPRLFGVPQPANGILTVDDEIRVNFNEKIADGYLTVNNFQVTGIRNGSSTEHSVSLSFDGKNDYLDTEVENNLTDKSITVGMWVETDSLHNATLFSHGNVNESMEMSFTADKHLQVKVGAQTAVSENAVSFDPGTWAHMAFTYDSDDATVSAFYNFSEVIHNAKMVPYSGIGNIELGRSISTGSNYFYGKMHGVQIWDKVLSAGAIQTNSLVKLSGIEQQLRAYYPMNEAKGIIAEDKARGANLQINGCKWTVPAGKAIDLDGAKGYVAFNTGSSAVIDNTMDYTLECWFIGAEGQKNTTILGNGRGDGNDNGGSANLFSLGFDANGNLSFANNGYTSVIDGSYCDNNWHHFAVGVSRAIGKAQIYVDGSLKNYFSADKLGGIAAANMYAGARLWYKQGDAVNQLADNFFKGQVDEVRIWNLYKTETLVSEYNNVKLDGNEMGLLAYYPFEYYKVWQGTNELSFTLADMKIQPATGTKVPDAVSHAVSETDVTPPVKDHGPVANLNFNYVVNNDALIITMNELPEKIEKTIVTFTVDGVRDVNGNENISPITWSAYIEHNQVRWSENSYHASTKAFQPLEFTLQAVNKGGAVEHYTISNMPSWLTVAPASGSLKPNSSSDITFTVSEGLNVGTYIEAIYLTNDDNVSEVLELTVSITGEDPAWTVNPSDYKYNMSVYGKLRINNLYSNDKSDMLAAFSNGKCVGVANVSYNKTLDMWYAFLTIYGNSIQEEGLEFRIWDAGSGKTYLATTSSTITFVNDQVVGTPKEPVIFDGKELLYQNIALNSGWNWISFNVNNSAMSSINNTLLNNEWSSSDVVKNEDLGFDSYSLSKGWMGTLTDNGGFNNKSLFMLKSNAKQTISILGSPVDVKSIPFTIKGKRWNYISYLPGANMTISEALADYEAKENDIVKSQTGFAMYAGNNSWIGSLTYMEQGKGYMLFRNDTSSESFTYPVNSGTLTKSVIVAQASDAQPLKYAENMTAVATLAGNTITETDDRIAVRVGTERQLVPASANNLFFVNMFGEDDAPVYFELERNGKVIAQTDIMFNFQKNNMVGTLKAPLSLNFKVINQQVGIYPNPFINMLQININLDEASDAEVSISNTVGVMVKKWEKQSLPAGNNQLKWDASNNAPGIYILKVVINGESAVYKIVKN